MTRSQLTKSLLAEFTNAVGGSIDKAYSLAFFEESHRVCTIMITPIMRGKTHFELEIDFRLYIRFLSPYAKFSPAFNPHSEWKRLSVTADIGYMRYKRWDKTSVQKPQSPFNTTEIGFPSTAQGVEQAVELLRGNVYTCFKEFTDKYSDLNTLEEIINREMDVLWHVLKHPPFDRAVLGIVLAKKCGKDYHKTAQRYEEYLKEKNLTWQGRNMPLEFIPELVNTLDRE